jgi:lipoyl synthase
VLTQRNLLPLKYCVCSTLQLLRDTGVDVVTLGQYMRPTKKHMAVTDFVTPEAFNYFQETAEQMGFLYVASGPMVRSSYRAGELFLKNVLRKADTTQVPVLTGV